jgi:hypothetical protein
MVNRLLRNPSAIFFNYLAELLAATAISAYGEIESGEIERTGRDHRAVSNSFLPGLEAWQFLVVLNFPQGPQSWQGRSPSGSRSAGRLRKM